MANRGGLVFSEPNPTSAMQSLMYCTSLIFVSRWRSGVYQRYSSRASCQRGSFGRTAMATYGDASRTYAQAWLVAHLLRHGSARHTALYRDFLGRLESAAGPEAVGATFDEATCRALDADLAAHQAALGARR